MNLREEIVSYIHRAIDSTNEYTGEEKDLNRHQWEQITTDRIIHAVIRELPMPINRAAKYEDFDGEGIPVTFSDDTKGEDVEYLAQFADDTGYNRYHKEMVEFFQNLYRTPQHGVQSKHDTEAKPIHRSDSNQEHSDQEPQYS